MSLLPAAVLLAAAADVAPPEAALPLSGSVTGYYFLVPSSPDSVVAIGSLDAKRTHVEARYGYEGVRTGSVFLGQRFDLVDRPFELRVTPMLGGVFGRTRGVAPGLEIEARLWRFELSTESEYVIDVSTEGASFFYNWSELVLRPTRFLVAGAVLERTRIFRERVEIEAGALVGFTAGAFTAKAYAFSPLGEEPFYVLALVAEL